MEAQAPRNLADLTGDPGQPLANPLQGQQGINTTVYSTPQPLGSLSTSQSWMVGLPWTDVFATSLTGGSRPNDGNDV